MRPPSPAAAPRPSAAQIQTAFEQALAHHQAGRVGEAEPLYRAVLSWAPDHADALHLLGVLGMQMGHAEAALALFDRALPHAPGSAAVHFNRGNALHALARHEEALASFDQALALRPDYPEAWLNRGNALAALHDPQEALASFERALALRPDYALALRSRGNALRDLRRIDEALASYDRALAVQPDDPDVLFNRGLALNDLHRAREALACFERSLAVRPDVHDVLVARGIALQMLQQHEPALASYDQALRVAQGDARTLMVRGMALEKMSRHDETLASYDQALALDPTHAVLFALRLHTQMKLCHWDGLQAAFDQLQALVRRADRAFDPFVTLATPLGAADAKTCAQTFARLEHPPAEDAQAATAASDDGRIRLGYFSADFHDHATAYLIAELFELHDRQRFELVAFSFGPVQDSPMRRRLEAAFDRFIDVREKSDADIARMARDLGIHIAVDLKGYTTDSRPGIFAHRAAPLQVAYLGYAGTMGAPYMDYVVADPIVIPAGSEVHYTEKVARLPHSYQVNDRRRAISDAPISRAAAGLPAQGVVFCCFNNSFKITPDVFDVWMRLLLQLEGSVLWLLEDNATAADKLRGEARLRGVAPERLVFAPRVPLAEHLARNRLADLFLDTFHYNAHTTASDALWAGLPLLTRPGETFASRVGASLLHAVGLPELVAESTEAYEALALALATDASRLAQLRERLAGNRDTQPLFDTPRFARHLESAFEQMWTRHQEGLAPAHLQVAG